MAAAERSDPRERWLRAVPFVLAALTVTTVLGVAAYVDRFARHGYSVSWYAQRHGERFETAHTTEHRVVIPNDHRPMSRYMENWDFAALGIPPELPPLDATFRAVVEVPPAGRYLHPLATGDTFVRVDGFPITEETRVSGGFHRVEVDWRTHFDAVTYFQLEWGPSPVAFERVPTAAIWPLDGDFPPMRRFLWIAALVVSATLALVVFRIARAEDEARLRLVHVWVVVALIVVGIGFRLVDYDVMPDWRDNSDEQLAAWNGYSLLENGQPRSWTLWPAEYGGLVPMEVTQYFGRTFHVISPYFEHPPLLHLLVGAAGHLGGAREYREVRVGDIRLVPIGLAALNLLLMVLIGRRIERRRIDQGGMGPYLGALLYAVLPWIVIQTRVVKEEALLTTLSLACIWFFLRFRESRVTRDLVIASVLAGLATLTKVPGFVFVIALSMLVLREAGPRKMALTVAIAVPLSALLLVYGAVYDWQLFLLTQRIQTSRMVHFNIFLRFFDDGLINHNVVGRGWLLFLWLGTMASLHRRPLRDAAVIGVPLMAYLASIALGSGTWTYGWYVTPLLPWLCLGAGFFLADLWAKPDIVRGGIVAFVLVFYSLNFVVSPDWMQAWAYHSEARALVTLVLVLSFGPFALASAWPGSVSKTIARAALVACLGTVIVVSGFFVQRYDELATVYHDFDRDRRFDR